MKVFVIAAAILAFCVLVVVGVGMWLYLTPGPIQREEAKTMPVAGEAADLALINGVIYTGDPAKPRVEAVASRGELIVATGTTAEIRNLIGPKTHVIDLKGGFSITEIDEAYCSS
jgi:hypothetical protein